MATTRLPSCALRKIYEKTTCFIAVPGAGAFSGCLRWSAERSRSDGFGKHPHCYTGKYPCCYTGAYPCPHTGEYTEAYTGTYAQAYPSTNTQTHTGAYARSYAGTHTGKYTSSFCIFLCGPFH